MKVAAGVRLIGDFIRMCVRGCRARVWLTREKRCDALLTRAKLPIWGILSTSGLDAQCGVAAAVLKDVFAVLAVDAPEQYFLHCPEIYTLYKNFQIN